MNKPSQSSEKPIISHRSQLDRVSPAPWRCSPAQSRRQKRNKYLPRLLLTIVISYRSRALKVEISDTDVLVLGVVITVALMLGLVSPITG